MARNHEKQYGKLNRLLLFKEKEEYEKKFPKRPNLNYLETAEEIQNWLPSIKRDLDFYLKKSEVTCYSDQHIEECKSKINSLEKEYKSFVRKLQQLRPAPLEAVPWTSRAYKRKSTDDPSEELPKKREFVPIPTPILNQESFCKMETYAPLTEMQLMDEPLVFLLDKELSPKSEQISSNNVEHLDNAKNAFEPSIKVFDKHSIDGSQLNPGLSVPISVKKHSIVNYSYSSDSDS